MTVKIYIHAVNVHQGGGCKLLEGLLEEIDCNDYEYVFILDERMPVSKILGPNITVRRIKPTIISRFIAEVWLFRNARRGDLVLCFGNLQPLFRLNAFTSVYLQNRYLVDRVDLSGFTTWNRVRITLERIWFKYAQRHANEYLVQTPSMQNLMNVQCHNLVSVKVCPFVVERISAKPTKDKINFSVIDFIYVASGDPHKNHRKLIQAWCMLADQNIYPKLVLTVDRKVFPLLCQWIDEKREEHNLVVENLGNVSSEVISDIYTNSAALIYPSTFESLGLPLIEAEQAGIPILASELDYVRDVVSPIQTFNPNSAISIAKAVKRFLGVNEPVISVGSPATFMRHLLDRLS